MSKSVGFQWVFIALLCCLGLVGMASASLGHWIFAISLLVVGMPHGFSDAVLIWQNKARVKNSVEYLLIACIVFCLWLCVPSLIAYLFLLLTAFHWGIGDFLSVKLSPLAKISVGMSKGLVLLSSVFFFDPSGSLRIMENLGAAEFLSSEAVAKIGLILMLGGLVSFFLLVLKLEISRRSAYLFEVMLLLVAASILPAFTTIMCYYVVIHCVRHYQFLFADWTAVNRRWLLKSHLTCLLLVGIPVFAGCLMITGGWSGLIALTEFQLRIIMFLTLPHAIFNWKAQAGTLLSKQRVSSAHRSAGEGYRLC